MRRSPTCLHSFRPSVRWPKRQDRGPADIAPPAYNPDYRSSGLGLRFWRRPSGSTVAAACISRFRWRREMPKLATRIKRAVTTWPVAVAFIEFLVGCFSHAPGAGLLLAKRIDEFNKG